MKTQVPGSRMTMAATPGDDLAQFMSSISSCHMDGVGTFHIYSPLPTHYMLVHEKSASESHAHINSLIFHCGKKVQRFIPVDSTRLMMQFYDFHLVVTIVTNDNWKTFKEERYSHRMLPLYLKIDSNPYPTATRVTTRATMKKRTRMAEPTWSLRLSYLYPILVHSSVLAARWPYFKSEMNKSNSKTIKMAYPSFWVFSLVDLLYGDREPLDLENAAGVLVLATKYKLPKLVELATRTIYALDINAEQALATWREVRKYSEAVARYCITRIKTSPSDVVDNYAERFQVFSIVSSEEDKDAFMAHMAPPVTIPRIAFFSPPG